MKTSVIEVNDMLSVLSVPGLEKRIGEVPGVESVTVNYAAKNATVRYDETRLNIADIKSDVRQSEYESAAPAAASARDGHKGHTPPGAPPAVPAAPPKSASEEVVSKTVIPAPKSSSAAAPISAVPKPTPDASAAAPESAAPAGDGKLDKTAPDKS